MAVTNQHIYEMLKDLTASIATMAHALELIGAMLIIDNSNPLGDLDREDEYDEMEIKLDAISDRPRVTD